MVIYEVNLAVNSTISETYAQWLRQHIAEILTLDGFIEAKWYKVDPELKTETVHFCVHYSLHSQEALQAYFTDHAPRLREDGLKQFPNQFTAHRRILVPHTLP